MISSATRANQRSRILGLLIAARGCTSTGGWVSLLTIKAEACQYNARILELRRLGFRIANKIREVDGVRMSWFRLESVPPAVPSKVDASQQPEAAGPEKFPEFGDLSPDRSYTE